MKTIATFNWKAGLFLISILMFQSCFKQETVKTTSGGSVEVSSNIPVRWPTYVFGSSGLRIELGDELDNELDAADESGGLNLIEQMLKEWNDSTSSLTFFNQNMPVVTNKDYGNLESYKSDGVLGIYKSSDWVSGVSSQALAVTQYIGYKKNVGTDSEYIELTHADIIVNFRDYTYSSNSTNYFSDSHYDLASVIVHELGHFLGLDHSSLSTPSVMHAYLSHSDLNREISSHDETNVTNLYGINALRGLASSGMMVANDGPKELPKSAREMGGGRIEGLIELRADGSCHHYINGKKTHTH